MSTRRGAVVLWVAALGLLAATAGGAAERTVLGEYFNATW